MIIKITVNSKYFKHPRYPIVLQKILFRYYLHLLKYIDLFKNAYFTKVQKLNSAITYKIVSYYFVRN